MKVIKKGFYPHVSNEEYCLCVNDHFVYKYWHASGKLEQYCRLPAKSNKPLDVVKDKVARSSIMRHFNHAMGIGHVVELPSKVLVILYDKIYRFDPATDGKTAKVVAHFESCEALPPLRNGIAVNPNTGDCYFGDYSNDLSRPSSIFRIGNNGQSFERVFSFSVEDVKHVHSVTWDDYRQQFWITTGDSDEQSWFYTADATMQNVQKFNGGDQTWRAVSLVILESALVWGMDAGQDATAEDINYLYHYDLTTTKRTRTQEIGSPAYHSIRTTSGKIIITTNFEPKCLQPIPKEAAIWVSNDGLDWSKTLSLPYEPTPKVNGSKYAYIYPPVGVVPDDSFVFTATNTGDYSCKLTRFSV